MSEETIQPQAENQAPTSETVSEGASSPLLDKLRQSQGTTRYSTPRHEMGVSGGQAPQPAPAAPNFAPKPQQDIRRGQGGGPRTQGQGYGPQGGGRGPRRPGPGGDQGQGGDQGGPRGARRLGDVPGNWGAEAPEAARGPKNIPASQVDRKIDPLDAELEAELQAALGNIEESLETVKTEKLVREATPGKKGRVYKINNGDVFVEIPGGRTQGLLTSDQFPEGLPEIGAEVDIKIERFDGANGILILTRAGQAVSNADWESLTKGMVVEAKVTEVKASGLEVMVNSCRGWLPASQIDINRTFDLNIFANQKLTCEVVEIDPHDKNLIVSRRNLLEKARAEQAEKLWAELAEGQVRDAIVRNLKDYGAFVDIGGADALLPASEMSWKRGAKVADMLHIGQSLKVQILRVDHENRKISVGLKQLVNSPWQNLQERFMPGTIVPGKVTRTEDFGAFVELEPEIEGLVHISEMGKGKVRRVMDVVKTGDEIKVMILSIDPETRRISLSIKATLEDAEPAEPAPTPGAPVPPPVPAKPTKPRAVPLRGGIGNGGPLIPPLV